MVCRNCSSLTLYFSTCRVSASGCICQLIPMCDLSVFSPTDPSKAWCSITTGNQNHEPWAKKGGWQQKNSNNPWIRDHHWALGPNRYAWNMQVQAHTKIHDFPSYQLFHWCSRVTVGFVCRIIWLHHATSVASPELMLKLVKYINPSISHPHYEQQCVV